MEEKKKTRLPAPTKYSKFDIKDTSWWQFKEMGSPDDPYNNIPKIKPTDREYDEYVEMAETTFDSMLKEYEKEEGWIFSKEDRGIKIEYKDELDDPIRCFRGSGIMYATPEVIRLHLVQIDLRHFWDPMFLGGSFHYEVTDSVRVVSYRFQAPWPVTNRDLVCIAGEKMTEDNVVVSAANSVVREDLPDQEGFVRAYLRHSGFVIKPLENDENGRPRCMVTYLVQLNPMGWIPTLVVNVVNVEQAQVINAINDAIQLTQTMIKDCMVKLVELPEEEWKATNLKKLIWKVVDGNNGKKEMLIEPFQYVLTGKRTGGDRQFEDVMEEMGKGPAIKKLWDGALPYVISIADKKMYEDADRYFSSVA